MNMHRTPCSRHLASRVGAAASTQRGLASLIVVVIIFVAMGMAMVYASRNLTMETRISGNQYRATLAMEAAEAGLEWATAMLNKSENINASCTTSAVSGDVSFKKKYLVVDTTNGAITAGAGTVHAACVSNQNASGWTCSCPAAGTAPSPSGVTPASGYRPSFAVAFVTSPVSGTVQLVSYGCTAPISDATCTGDGAATVRVAVGGVSGLATPPAAPLTARGRVSIGNAALGVINGDPSSNGITINAGMDIDASNVRVTSVPGTPPQSTLVGNDVTLRNTTEDQMFATFFGMSKTSYKTLPSVKRITCPCTESTLTTAYAQGARQFWLDGNLEMNANITIGSETDPVLVVVDGTVEMRGDLRLFGVFYSTAITWNNTGGGSALLQGAAISEGNYTGNGTPDYYYDPRVLTRLRYDLSSFVRVPGSWRDF
jgi:Tfp pilus assembly protein PilX